MPLAVALAGIAGACTDEEQSVENQSEVKSITSSPENSTISSESILVQSLTVLISTAAGAVLAGYLLNKRNKHNSEIEVDIQNAEDTELSDDSWKSDPLAYIQKIGIEQKTTQEKLVFMYEFLLEWIESLSTEKRELEKIRKEILKLKAETEKLHSQASARFIESQRELEEAQKANENITKILSDLQEKAFSRDPALNELVAQGSPSSEGSSTDVAKFIANGGDLTSRPDEVYGSATPQKELPSITPEELTNTDDQSGTTENTSTERPEKQVASLTFPAASIFLGQTLSPKSSGSQDVTPTPVSGVKAVPKDPESVNETSAPAHIGAEEIKPDSENTSPSEKPSTTGQKGENSAEKTSFEEDPTWGELFEEIK